MKLKNGFTLIEIILSIGLIVIVGGISLMSFNLIRKNDKENDLKDKILEAANLYAQIKFDKSGRVYNEMIIKGNKGVVIPLKNLVNDGYLDRREVDQIYEESDDEPYVLYLLGGATFDYCEEGQITILPSWEDLEEPIYLCDSKGGGTSIEYKTDLIHELVNQYTNVFGESETISNYSDLEKYRKRASRAWGTCATPEISFTTKNGLFKKNTNDYFYFGTIEYNYVKVSGELFRIVGFSFDEGSIDLITEKPIDTFYVEYASKTSDDGEFVGSIVYNAIQMWFDSLYEDFTMLYKNEYYYDYDFDYFLENINIKDKVFREFDTGANFRLLSSSEVEYSGAVGYADTCGYATGLVYGETYLNSDVNSNSTILSSKSYFYSEYTGSNYTLLGAFSNNSPGFNDKEKLKTRIRPIISLKGECIKFKGEGTIISPYEIIVSTECDYEI